MSGRVAKLDSLSHQAAQELLPWFVTNALGAEEMGSVRAHLRACAQCRDDADRQRMLRAMQPPSSTLPNAEGAFARLRPRLVTALRQSAQKPEQPMPSGFLRRLSGAGVSWMRWALAAQAVIIAVLAVLVMRPDAGPVPYRALGTPASAAGNVAVMFKPDTTEQELRRILQDSGARLVDGPTAAGAYVLHIPRAQQQASIAVLRSKAAVALAEPLDPGGSR